MADGGQVISIPDEIQPSPVWNSASNHTYVERLQLANQEWRRQLEESDRRFYRNLNEIRIERGMPLVNSLYDPIGNEVNNRTIFVKIWNEIYPISREILHSVFSGFGILVGIERLSSGFHSSIRFFDKESTIKAFESLNGRNIYDDCCKLELFLATPMESSSSNQESATLEEIEGASNQDTTSKGESNGDVENPIQESEVEVTPHVVEEFNEPEIFFNHSMSPTSGNLEGAKSEALDVPEQTGVDDLEEAERIQEEVITPSPESFELVKVNSFTTIASDYMSAKLGELIVLLIELIEMRLSNFSTNSVKCFRNLSAHKVFVEMPTKHVQVQTRLEDGTIILSTKGCLNSLSRGTSPYLLVFDPGGDFDGLCSGDNEMPYNRGKLGNEALCDCSLLVFGGQQDGLRKHKVSSWVDVALVIASIGGNQIARDEDLIFDPGIARQDVELRRPKSLISTHVTGHMKVLIASCIDKATNTIIVFDPGGSDTSWTSVEGVGYVFSSCSGVQLSFVLL